MAIKGKIYNHADWFYVEQVATECDCGLEKIVVTRFKDKKPLPEDDFVFIEFIHYPESFKERWKDFVKGYGSHEAMLSNKEFLDFVEKLNELAKEIKLETGA